MQRILLKKAEDIESLQAPIKYIGVGQLALWFARIEMRFKVDSTFGIADEDIPQKKKTIKLMIMHYKFSFLALLAIVL